MNDPFDKHRDPRYARPDARWRCGRAACWGRPCASGPGLDGTCGAGKDELQCVPRATLRVLRGRAVLFVSALTVCLLGAGFHFGNRRMGGLQSLSANPGPLSATHANFTENQGCAACHPAHSEGLAGLTRAVVTPQNMTGQCIECHTFAGKERLAHNATYSHRSDVPETRCTTCHVEHRGARASLTAMTEAQCRHCHQVQFDSFTRGHPAFPTNFPHRLRSGIHFNHAKHIGDYFSQAAYQSRAPANCQECHRATAGERRIETTGFDVACARCHEQETRENFLSLLALPEPATNARAVLSADDSTKAMKWILGPADGPAAYSARLRELLRGLTNGISVLAATLNRAVARPVGSNLLAGLNRELVARPATMWGRGEKFTAESTAGGTGWSWIENDNFQPELRYVPLGHADLVAKEWVEAMLDASASATNADQRAHAQALRDELFDSAKGPGRCAKCHSVSEATAGSQTQRVVAWRYRGGQLGPHTTFSHGTHLGVAACLSCHALNFKADFAPQFASLDSSRAVSNFKPITTANCIRCHSPGQVRSDCFLCHHYHESPGLRRTVLTTR